MFASAVYFINTTIMSNPLGENEHPWWVLLPVALSLILVTYKVKDLWFGIRTNRTFCQNTVSSAEIPESVNYHFTRQCNYSCGFCFHTAKTSYVLPEDEAQRGLSMLAKAGMKKVNFSGGEPFLKKNFLGECVKFCKEELEVESVTIVTNGSKVTRAWMEEYGYYLDILAVSCDSFNEDTNEKIGRRAKGRNDHLQIVSGVRDLCEEFNVMFKLNTVVNRHNFEEDMSDKVSELNPVRWKVFQCLPIEAENRGPEALRQVDPFLISDQEFSTFVSRHRGTKVGSILVPESNEAMRDSYLILDEYMRFLDNSGGEKKPSPSILDVGVEQALKFSGFDEKMFLKRGGRYKWSKKDQELDW